MPGILWLASYPKSGNTWLRAFLHNLMRNPDSSYDINRLTDLTVSESQAEWYRRAANKPEGVFSDEEVLALRPIVHRNLAEAAAPGNAIVKTHNALIEQDGHALVTLEVTAGAIYIVRNPLDVVISLSHHNRTTIDVALEFMSNRLAATAATDFNVYEVYNSWSEHVLSWTATPSPTLHVIRYEDMIAKPYQTFASVVRFLGLPVERPRIEKAIRLSSFNVLKEQERRRGFRERPLNVDAFFREGKVGQWRNVLTPEQVAAIVSAHSEQMARFGYLPKAA